MATTGHEYQSERPGRVKVVYETDVNGKMKMVELPFVMGVLADLSGNAGPDKAELAKRSFDDVTAASLDTYVESVAPRIQYRVENTLVGEGEELYVDLSFEKMAHFRPDEIARRFAPLRELLEMREALQQLLTKIGGKPEAEKAVAALLRDVDAERGKSGGQSADA